MKKRINNIDVELGKNVVILEIDDMYPHESAKAGEVVPGQVELGTQDIDFLIEDLIQIREAMKVDNA